MPQIMLACIVGYKENLHKKSYIQTCLQYMLYKMNNKNNSNNNKNNINNKNKLIKTK